MLIGPLTLLARGAPSGGVAGIAPVAVAVNKAGVALAMAFRLLTRRSEPQGPILVAPCVAPDATTTGA